MNDRHARRREAERSKACGEPTAIIVDQDRSNPMEVRHEGATNGSDGRPDDVTGARLVPHSRAAQMLGVSSSTMRRLARAGDVPPAMIGERGERYFDEVVLVEKRATLRTSRRSDDGDDDGDRDLAIAAFQLFVDGLSPVEAVIRLRATPHRIQSLYLSFRAMKDEHRRALQREREAEPRWGIPPPRSLAGSKAAAAVAAPGDPAVRGSRAWREAIERPGTDDWLTARFFCDDSPATREREDLERVRGEALAELSAAINAGRLQVADCSIGALKFAGMTADRLREHIERGG